jgi:hypothetical protein
LNACAESAGAVSVNHKMINSLVQYNYWPCNGAQAAEKQTLDAADNALTFTNTISQWLFLN